MPSTFLESRIEREKVVEGERLIYEVVLLTDNPDLAGVDLSSMPAFGNLPHRQASPGSGFSSEVREGKEYFSVVLDRYFVVFNQKGVYPIGGGTYRIGVNRQESVVDPFWGPVLRNRVDVSELEAPDIKVKVLSLPEKGKPADFSGAVGDFTISASLPEEPGNVGEDMCVIINVSGEGDLTTADLPDMLHVFPEGLQFKSMTDNRSHYVKDGRLGSELEIEVVFHPKKEGSYTLDGIQFVFFNTRRGKYERVVAAPLTIEVESGVPGSSKPSVTLDI